MKMRANPMQRATNEPLALREAPRCGARTRQGKPCQSPIVKGKRRCRMHGEPQARERQVASATGIIGTGSTPPRR
jgi:hypothetical protein